VIEVPTDAVLRPLRAPAPIVAAVVIEPDDSAS